MLAVEPVIIPSWLTSSKSPCQVLSDVNQVMSFAFSKSVGSAGVILMSKEPWDAPRARRPSGPRQAAPDSSPTPLILRIALAYRLRNATLRILDLPTAFASSSSTSRWQLDYGSPYTLGPSCRLSRTPTPQAGRREIPCRRRSRIKRMRRERPITPASSPACTRRTSPESGRYLFSAGSRA